MRAAPRDGALLADSTEGEALTELQTFFGALDVELSSPVVGLPKPALIRFELAAGSGPGWTWEVRASPDAAGGVTSPSPAGAAAAMTPLTSSSAPAPADCTVSCTLVHFLDLATGRLKPASALLRGLVKIRGDRSVFLLLRVPMAAAGAAYKAAAAAVAAQSPASGVAVEVVAVGTVTSGGQTYATYTVSAELCGGRLLVRWRAPEPLSAQPCYNNSNDVRRPTAPHPFPVLLRSRADPSERGRELPHRRAPLAAAQGPGPAAQGP